jgi:mannose-6-phosphate isomerase
MVNSIRGYDWGSTRALAALCGHEPSGQPEAELWMGAHPAASSRLRQPDGHDVSLSAAIEADPMALLGRESTEWFGARLPFLLKVLAVERALSIQVHPSAVQAAAGFAREQALGVPQAQRNYLDPYAKPEMLLPLTRFAALAGFRRRDQIVAMMGRLAVAALQPVLLTLTSRRGQDGPAVALANLATWPPGQRQSVADSIRDSARKLLDEPAACLDADEQSSLEWVITLAGQHPGDLLAMAPLLLRLHQLEPEQAMYLPAGVPHAYLSGFGLEIMASSDNVVRGGLTRKHVDAQALVDLLNPDAAPLLEVPRVALGAQEIRWQPPVPDFALSKIRVGGTPTTLARQPGDPAGPEILLCTSGAVSVSSDGGSLNLRSGQSAFLSATASPAVLAGRGEVYRATVGHIPAHSPA